MGGRFVVDAFEKAYSSRGPAIPVCLFAVDKGGDAANGMTPVVEQYPAGALAMTEKTVA
jgi:hypothetical protein